MSRLSYGLGLAVKLGGIARIELNYCIPVKVTVKVTLTTIRSMSKKDKQAKRHEESKPCHVLREKQGYIFLPFQIEKQGRI